MKVKVLRLSHRVLRDKRLTTHIALISRALGADEVVLSGERDDTIIKTVDSVTNRWGGPFQASYEKNWDKFLYTEKKNGAEIIHLTMYGIPFEKMLPKIKKSKKPKVIVVGSEKVPGKVYGLASYNIAVTNQPHSEAGALAVFLYALLGARKKFKAAITKIVPQEHGKKVIKRT